MIIHFQFRSVADYSEAPLVPIIVAAVLITVFIVVLLAVLVWLSCRRQSPLNAYSLPSYTALVTVQPHPNLGRTASEPLPPYEQLQATNEGATQSPECNQPSGMIHTPYHHQTEL